MDFGRYNGEIREVTCIKGIWSCRSRSMCITYPELEAIGQPLSSILERKAEEKGYNQIFLHFSTWATRQSCKSPTPSSVQVVR